VLKLKDIADELGPERFSKHEAFLKRAKAVMIFWSSGVDWFRLSFKGYGEDTSVDKSLQMLRQNGLEEQVLK